MKERANHSPEEINVPLIRFLGEQDGSPERELKGALVKFFAKDGCVEAAYLARVAYENTSQSVALCIRSRFGEDPALAGEVGRIFSGLFGAHEHLDIVFVSEPQERELQRVCCPFFANR